MNIVLQSYEIEMALKEYVSKHYKMELSKDSYTELVINKVQYERFKNGNYNFKKKKEVSLLLDDNSELSLYIEVKND